MREQVETRLVLGIKGIGHHYKHRHKSQGDIAPRNSIGGNQEKQDEQDCACSYRKSAGDLVLIPHRNVVEFGKHHAHYEKEQGREQKLVHGQSKNHKDNENYSGYTPNQRIFHLLQVLP